MGRHKIEIKRIDNQKTRQITFNKRRSGLFKKAYELAALTSSSVTLLVRGENGKNYVFQSDNQPLHQQLDFEYETLSKDQICDYSDNDTVPASSATSSYVNPIENSQLKLCISIDPPQKRQQPSLQVTIPPPMRSNDLFSPNLPDKKSNNFMEIQENLQSPMYFSLNTPVVVDTPNGPIVVNTPKGGMAEKMLFPTQ
ncbi:MADS-box protein [Spironucleus salmonicida]|uniref:MADS-box protein n=1 Tax=Spironucleus salmonicida TaxID=348837 RepID=V6LCY0_9EUKA|nr:MADS-box protein [Spironucleus salmonicida]|eukprot:EST41536.1 MADS-box protein [Spironucleus salmonicida]